MLMTATAAGSVSATTASRVAVTAGTVYTAYAYFGSTSTGTSRTASVTVTWYAAVTGGTALSSVTSAAVAHNGTGWVTPPPTLIATAPAGATYASVTVSASGVAAGAAMVTDVVSIGPPALISGNLLAYNVQGAEVDASGWEGIWQMTVASSTTRSFEGWRSITLTSTGTGACRADTVSAISVTAGVEYMGYAYVYAPSGATEWHTGIRWYDASGTLISSSSQTWSPMTASTWIRCAVIDTAPPGAVTARLLLEPVATAVGQVWTCDQMAILPTPLTPGNLLGYNAQSIEITSTPWTALSGCSKGRSLLVSYEGISSLAITCDGTGDATVQLTSTVPVTARQAYRSTPSIYHTGRATPPVVDLLFYWYNSAGILIESSLYRWSMGTTAGWYAPVGSAVAPDGAVAARIGLRFLAPANGDVFYADALSIAPGGLGAIADLIDGSYGARVSIQGLTTDGKSKWGVWRMLDDGSMTPLRGPDGDLTATLITGDLAIVEDYEAPLGVEVQYYVKTFTGSSYQAATSDTVTLPEPADTSVIIKDPGLPARWAESVVARGGMPDWTRSARQGVNPVRGRARPIIITDVRASRTGTLTLVTETQDELDSMWWLLETGNTLLLQWPSEWGERDVYVQVGDVTEAHTADYAGYQDRTWTVPLTEVDRPIGGITGSTSRTWQSLVDTRADWLDVLNNADSWLDVYTGVQGG
jgi:hypothetical protein